MDSSIIAAVSALLGSAVGGLTTFATTFFNQRYVARREMLVKDVANREQLYGEFLKEVADLYKESLSRTLDDLSAQPSLITMYSLIGRIRMISSEPVLAAAEKIAEDIIESYKRPQITFKEWQQFWGPADPWHEFTKAWSSRAKKHARTLVVLPMTNPMKTGYYEGNLVVAFFDYWHFALDRSFLPGIQHSATREVGH
jgi:hypothetical protein